MGGADDKVLRALEGLIDEAGGPDQLVVPRGYSHLGLAIIDAVFSLRARYDTMVVPVLKRYCEAADGISWATAFDENATEHGARAVLRTLTPLKSEERCGLLNRQLAPGTKQRKADVVVELATGLQREDVDTCADLAATVARSKECEARVLRIGGVGPAAWRYLLNLSRIEKVKPDTRVMAWVADVVGSPQSPGRSAELLESAAKRFDDRISVRAVDHLVWRKASGRPLTDSA